MTVFCVLLVPEGCDDFTHLRDDSSHQCDDFTHQRDESSHLSRDESSHLDLPGVTNRQQRCDESSHPSKNKEINNITISHTSANLETTEHVPDEADERASERGEIEGDFDLSFLPEKDRVYEHSMRAQIAEFPIGSIDLAYVRILAGSHRGTCPVESLLALVEKFSHEWVVAALVYAKAEGRGGASLKFIDGILSRWLAHQALARNEASQVPRVSTFVPSYELEQEYIDDSDDLPEELKIFARSL